MAGAKLLGGWKQGERRQLRGQGDAGGEGTPERPHANGPACQELADLALSKPQGWGALLGRGEGVIP